MAESNQIESWNQQNRNKENNTMNQWDQELVTIDMEEIQRIIRSYFENLYSTKLKNLKEMDNFLDNTTYQN